MRKAILGLIGIFLLIGSNVFASGFVPIIGIDPFVENNKSVKLEVGPTLGDGSWLWLPLETAIDTSEHQVITVEFDILRDSIGGLQQLVFGWVNEADNWTAMQPIAGAQESYGPDLTYPFMWFGDYASYHANTVYDRWAHIELQWDFVNNLARAWYDGTQVSGVAPSLDPSVPIINPQEFLYGFDISLNTGNNTTHAGGDVVWIDNFIISGSAIYNSNGFESFSMGSVNGQDGWVASKGDGIPPVPEPATILLFGLGILSLAGVSRHKGVR